MGNDDHRTQLPPKLRPSFHHSRPFCQSLLIAVSAYNLSAKTCYWHNESSQNSRVTTADRRTPTMDQHDDFDSVSWKHDPDSDASRPTTAGTDAAESSEIGHDTNGKRRMSSAHEEPQAGPLADAVDLAGIGDGVLECQVDSPLKENDGTKDAYISYLVTTHVCAFRPSTAAA